MDGGAWWAAVPGVAKSRTPLSDFTFTFHFHALEKEMATHSSVLAWRIPGTGEPGGLPSMELHRVGHDWNDLAVAVARCGRSEFDPCVGKVPWRRKWYPTAVLLPGKSRGWRSLVGYSQRGRKESDMTERLHFLSFCFLCLCSSVSLHCLHNNKTVIEILVSFF